MAASSTYQLTPDGRQYLQTIINQFKDQASSGLEAIIPMSLRSLLTSGVDLASILRSISYQLILHSIRYAPIVNGTRMINAGSIQPGFRSLYTVDYPRTFKFSGNSGLKHDQLAGILQHYGFIPDTSTGLGFLMLEYNPGTSKFTKEDTMLPCIIKNLLGETKTLITNKEILYTSMLQEDPVITAQGLAATEKLTPDLKVKPGEVLIIRPVGPMACCGRGISVVTTDLELNRARSLVRSYKSAIASTYIPNPLLWHDRKFHIRMYLLIRAGTPTIPYHCELWTRGKILTALLPYRMGDWNNKQIHDTHGDSTPHNLWFPEDLPDISRRQDIFTKMTTITSVVGRIMEKNLLMYPESISAFEVFGCDFLVTSDYNVVLLEINDHVGFKSLKEPETYTDNELTRTWYRGGAYTYDDFSFDYYRWIYTLGIHPIYFPANPIPPAPSFI